MSAVVLLLALALGAPDPPAQPRGDDDALARARAAIASDPRRPWIGRIRVVRGRVLVDGIPAGTRGWELADGANVDSGALGFVELSLGSDVRLRVSASTRVNLEVDEVPSTYRLRLATGRVWVQSGASMVRVATPFGDVRGDGASSFIVEQTRSTGVVVTVRAGAAHFEVDALSTRLEPGQVVTRAPGARAAPRARPGGSGLGDLVAFEAARSLGDWTGARAFLVERAATSELAATAPRGYARSDADRVGADADSGGGLLEEAIRPPPFFEDEVPAKGPNVRVEITFGED